LETASTLLLAEMAAPAMGCFVDSSLTMPFVVDCGNTNAQQKKK
jgi:hypothetical protein